MLADIIPKIAGMTQGDHGPYYPRPSMASPSTPEDPGRCVRAMTYAKLGIPQAPWPGRFLLVLDDSSWHEELTLDWIRKSSYTVHSCQCPVNFLLPHPIGTGGYCRHCNAPIPNTVLHGHIDALLTDLLAIDRLMEHKALNRFGFERVMKGEPPLDYLTQSCLYLAALQNQYPTCREGLLLVKSKDTAAYCEFRFTYDRDQDHCHVIDMVASQGLNVPLDFHYRGLITSAIEKFDTVERHAADHTLPPRPYRNDHFRCDYCPWSKQCWDGYPAEVTARDASTLLDPAVAPLLAEYAEAAGMKRLGEATTKRLRPQILHALEAQHTRTGIADGYRATVTATTRTTLDEALIPEDIKHAAQTPKVVETLRVVSTDRARDVTEGD